MVLWTRLTGGDLRRARGRALGSRRGRGLRRIVASGVETAEAAWAHSVHAEPAGLGAGPLVLVPLQRARRAQRGRPDPHRAGRRRRGQARLRDRQLPALGRSATTPPGATSPRKTSTWCSSSATTSTSTPSRPDALRHVEGGRGRDPRAIPRALRHLQARPAAAGRPCPRAVAAGLGRPRGRATTMRTCRAEHLAARLRRAARRRVPRLLGTHAVPEGVATGRPRHAHHRPPRLGAAGAHPPARRPPVPRCAGVPEARARRLEHRGARGVPRARRSEAQPARRRRRSAGSPKAGTLSRPWNLLAQQTLMARFSWTDPAAGGGTYWTDGWDGYAPARDRLLGTVAERRVPGVVVLGGDVHSELRRRPQGRLRRPALAGRRDRVLRHLDHQPVARRRRASTRPGPSTRTSTTAAATSAATSASASTRSASRRGCAWSRMPAIRRAACGPRRRFVVDPARPGAVAPETTPHASRAITVVSNAATPSPSAASASPAIRPPPSSDVAAHVRGQRRRRAPRCGSEL